MKLKNLFLAGTLLLLASNLVAQDVVPSGTEIKVRTDQQITVDSNNVGQSYTASVSEDVTDSSGRVVIPRGSRAHLTSMKDGSKAALDLTSVTVRGRRYNIEAKAYKTGSLGANKTTAKYAGGGALAGTLIGAIAGGGKGAAIGALAGAGAGAGAQALTAGKKINIPAESELKFKTAQDLELRTYAPRSSRRR